MSKENIRPVVRKLLPLAFALGVTCSAAAADAARRFEIASQDLATALNQFAVAADCQIVFAPSLVKNMRSPAVSGTYTPEEVIRRLLLGTDLSVRTIGPGTYAVEPRGAQPASGKAVTDKQSSSTAQPDTERRILLARGDADTSGASAANNALEATEKTAAESSSGVRRAARADAQDVPRDVVALPEARFIWK